MNVRHFSFADASSTFVARGHRGGGAATNGSEGLDRVGLWEPSFHITHLLLCQVFREQWESENE